MKHLHQGGGRLEGWIKWLGEIVWRMADWPRNVKGNEREENFWYRTYGVGSLILALAFGMWFVANYPEPISKLVSMATTYTGSDKLLAQSYIGVGLVLVVGVPIVIAGLFLLASFIMVVTFIGLVVFKGFALGVGWLANRWLERQPTQKRRSIAFAAAGALLGAVAGYYAAYMAQKAEKQAAEQETPVALPGDKKPAPPPAL